VALLDRDSEAKMQALIRWEAAFVGLVVVVGAVLLWHFVRTERALQESRGVALDALRQSDALKTALLSSASHDLRTPLAAIQSLLFALREEDSTDSRAIRTEFVHRIRQEVDGLDRLVGNLLDLSRIEAGAVVLRREWHLIEELVEEALRRMEPVLADRPLRIDLPRHSPPLYVDGVAIQQVLINLLDNAVKYSPSGSPITLRATMTPETVEVEVISQGGGIASGELDRVFDRFYRARSRQPDAPPGCGLGLAICKGFVEAHGGTILIRSASGGPTMVLFSLPQWKADSPLGAEEAEPRVAVGERP
jgi:two-component system sensor histidine kinase KdpD